MSYLCLRYSAVLADGTYGFFAGGFFGVSFSSVVSFSGFTLGTCAVSLRFECCSWSGVLTRCASVGCTQFAKIELNFKRALHVLVFNSSNRSVGL